MSISYTKRLKNEMENLEYQSDKIISPEKYYIIKIYTPADFNTMKNMGKIFLARNTLHVPLVTYVFQNEICLIFSCMNEDQTHYLNGSQQKIISEYSSYVSVELGCPDCIVNIIEFESQTQVVSYLIWKTYTNSQLCAYNISNKSITMEDINLYTQTEMIEKLGDLGINWEDISSEEKYGIFLKLKKEKNTYMISTLSEYLDARNSKKYINYIFGTVV